MRRLGLLVAGGLAFGSSRPADAVIVPPLVPVNFDLAQATAATSVPTTSSHVGTNTMGADPQLEDETLWALPAAIYTNLDALYEQLVQAYEQSKQADISSEAYRGLAADQQRYIHAVAHLLAGHVRKVQRLSADDHDSIYKNFDAVLLNHSTGKRNGSTKTFLETASPCMRQLIELAAKWGDKTDVHRIPYSAHHKGSYHRSTRMTRFFPKRKK